MPHKHHQAIAAASGASKGKPLIVHVQLRPKPRHQCLVAHPELLEKPLYVTILVLLYLLLYLLQVLKKKFLETNHVTIKLEQKVKDLLLPLLVQLRKRALPPHHLPPPSPLPFSLRAFTTTSSCPLSPCRLSPHSFRLVSSSWASSSYFTFSSSSSSVAFWDTCRGGLIDRHCGGGSVI
jgi:hypothetical protein